MFSADHNKNCIEPLSSEQKKPYYGKLFGSQLINTIYKSCEETHEQDIELAITRIKAYSNVSRQETIALCKKGVVLLQSARLTMNFSLQALDLKLLSNTEGRLINCFEKGNRPQDPPGYILGRARFEESLFCMESLFESSPYGRVGKYESDQNVGIMSKDFQPFSRPIYGALDFLNGNNGGAVTYGKSFLVFKDHIKQRATYAPVDTLAKTVSGDKLATFFHMEKLIANMQSDLFGYNCFKSFIKKLQAEEKIPHKNYGLGGQNNYIEAQIHTQPLLYRDVAQVNLAREELAALSPARQIEVLEFANLINTKTSNEFIRLIPHHLSNEVYAKFAAKFRGTNSTGIKKMQELLYKAFVQISFDENQLIKQLQDIAVARLNHRWNFWLVRGRAKGVQELYRLLRDSKIVTLKALEESLSTLSCTTPKNRWPWAKLY